MLKMKRGFGGVPEEKTKREVDFIWGVLKLRKGTKILDLFCGTGRHSTEFAERGCDAYGVEYNPEYLRLAKKRAKEPFYISLC